MYNCLFTAHCLETTCDQSCPILAETSYLLERNDISFKSSVFSASITELTQVEQFLDSAADSDLSTYIVNGGNDSVKYAELLTYVAICKFWKGSRLHCNVYNLKYSKYLEDLKNSWGYRSEPESLQYSKIWIESAKLLIVSNLDYINFGDFECQTLLNLLQLRRSSNLSTIIVSPLISQLVSTKSSRFFYLLSQQLQLSIKEVH